MGDMKRTEPQFVVCIRNKQYPASLELRKLYQVLPDQAAAKHGPVSYTHLDVYKRQV